MYGLGPCKGWALQLSVIMTYHIFVVKGPAISFIGTQREDVATSLGHNLFKMPSDVDSRENSSDKALGTCLQRLELGFPHSCGRLVHDSLSESLMNSHTAAACLHCAFTPPLQLHFPVMMEMWRPSWPGCPSCKKVAFLSGTHCRGHVFSPLKSSAVDSRTPYRFAVVWRIESHQTDAQWKFMSHPWHFPSIAKS